VAFPVLLLAIGGAAAAAVALASSTPVGGGGGGGPSETLSARMAAWGYRWNEGVEKFADPRIVNCWGYAIRPRLIAGQPLPGVYCLQCINHAVYVMVYGEKGGDPDGRPDFLTTGLDYLNASGPTAKGRIAVLRKRVDQNGAIGSGAADDSSLIGSLATTSAKAMRAAAIDFQAKLGDAKGRTKLAEALGIPVSKMADAEKAFESAVVNAIRDKARIDVSSLFADLKGFSGGVLGSALSKVGQIVAGAVSGTTAAASSELAAALASAGGITSAVSTIMPLLKIAADYWLTEPGKLDTAAKKTCADQMNEWVLKPIKETLQDGYPIPWNLTAIYDLSCTNEDRFSMALGRYADDPNTAANDAGLARLQAEDIGAGRAAVELKRFWAQLLLVAADPRMVKVLRAMGRQKGLWGSDEQVVVVGTAIAIAFDLEPWGFCEALWGYSFGWWQYRELAKPGIKAAGRGVSTVVGVADVECMVGYKRGSGSSPDTPGTPSRTCKDQPYNAWSLNLAAIAACAFKLADEMAKDRPAAPASPGLTLRAMVPR